MVDAEEKKSTLIAQMKVTQFKTIVNNLKKKNGCIYINIIVYDDEIRYYFLSRYKHTDNVD